MIPLLTRDAVRAVDHDAAERLGLPTIALMESAAAGAVRELLARMRGSLARPLVVGGTGQNGGDAWALARHLVTAGITPRAVLVGDERKVKGDARTNLEVLRALGVDVLAVATDADISELEDALAEATLVVDGLFGTGLDRPVDGIAARAISTINERGLPCVALDVPSGVDADSGAVLGVAVHAALTTTFAAHKRGLFQHPARDLAGEVVLVPIGVPAATGASSWLVDAPDVAALLLPRARDAHKGDAGRVVLFAGAPGTTGAALLAARGALRAGAGLVTVAPRPDARAAVDAKSLETMTAHLPPGDGKDAVDAAVALSRLADACVVGPGFGHGDALAVKLAIALAAPAVLDADALTALGGKAELLRSAEAPRVLTPHPGEAARLLEASVDDVQGDRFAAAHELAERTGHVVVLKGAGTLITSPDGETRVCVRGTPALATGGTGDVLAGVIAALLPGLTPLDAATLGVLVHAIAGELAAGGRDRGLLAHEVADAVPRAMTT